MLKLKSSRCTECEICMQICSWTHLGEFNTKRSRVVIEADWPETPTIRVCLDCKGRECVAACPTQALSWNQWIQLDPTRCDSCGACAEACPVRGIEMDPATRYPLVCDTCQGAFECVKWCPTQAIERKV